MRRSSRTMGRFVAAGIAVVALAAAGATGAAAKPRHGHGHGHKSALSITKSSFGSVGSQPVDRYTLANHDMSVSIITYGGIVQARRRARPARAGGQRHARLRQYRRLHDRATTADAEPAYFGAIIGRYGNRIAKGRFTLDGTKYSLDINNGPNSLHGGFRASTTRSGTATPVQTPESVGVKLTYTCPPARGARPVASGRPATGFPGTVTSPSSTRWTPATTCGSTTRRRPTRRPSSTSPTTPTGTWRARARGRSTITGSAQCRPLHTGRQHLIPTGGSPRWPARRWTSATPHAIGERIRDNDEQLIFGRGYDHNWVLNRLPGEHQPGRGSHAARSGQRPHADDLHRSAGDPVLLGQLPRRHALRHERPRVPPGRRARAGDPALPRLAQPAGLPLDGLRPGETYSTSTIYAFSASRHH